MSMSMSMDMSMSMPMPETLPATTPEAPEPVGAAAPGPEPADAPEADAPAAEEAATESDAKLEEVSEETLFTQESASAGGNGSTIGIVIGAVAGTVILAAAITKINRRSSAAADAASANLKDDTDSSVGPGSSDQDTDMDEVIDFTAAHISTTDITTDAV